MTKSKRSKTRRIRPKYNQRGCSQKGGTCPSCGESSSIGPILGIGQTGGCETCMKGGNFYKTDLPPVPGPFVGNPWGPKVSEWPGVDGVDHSRNYFTNNLYLKDPQTMMKLGGSKKRSMKRNNKQNNKRNKKNKKSRTKITKGGALFQDLSNLGNDLTYNFHSMYNTISGYKPPVNPAPYADQFSKTIKSSL
jgi:hypothetical protein